MNPMHVNVSDVAETKARVETFANLKDPHAYLITGEGVGSEQLLFKDPDNIRDLANALHRAADQIEGARAVDAARTLD